MAYAWIVSAIVVSMLVLSVVLAMRWTRRLPAPPDLRRADEAEAPDDARSEEELELRITEAYGEARFNDGM